LDMVNCSRLRVFGWEAVAGLSGHRGDPASDAQPGLHRVLDEDPILWYVTGIAPARAIGLNGYA